MKNELVASALPRKAFFIQMFTKDIALEDCILDLIDNSIDGLMQSRRIPLSRISRTIFRKESGSKPRRSSLPIVRLVYSEDSIAVEDNCGGIDLTYALSEAFNFGHIPGYKGGYLGAYGVGLKRALFKIGSHFEIKSQTTQGGFVCKLDVDKWLREDSSIEHWRIPLARIGPAKLEKKAGTRITITRLHTEVKARIRQGGFDQAVQRAIERTYPFFLGQHVRVEINGVEVKSPGIPIGGLDGGTASSETFEREGVKVRIVANLAHRDGRGRLSVDRAGWYAVCNGRVVLAADKTERSGWGIHPMPQFHSKHSFFLGIVFFESKDPLLLPWTTTKRDLNQESMIYLYAKQRMISAALPIVKLCSRMYPADQDYEPIEREISKGVKPVPLGRLASRTRTLFNLPKRRRPAIKPTTSVQYEADNRDLEKIRKHLRKPRLGAGHIGRYTFKYYMRQENLE